MGKMAHGEIKMKKIALLLMVLSTSAFATAEVPMAEFCPKIAELANGVMVARQNGSPMREVMALADGNDVMVSMVTEAYGHPAYSTSEVQEKTIQDFEDTWYLRCVKSYDL